MHLIKRAMRSTTVRLFLSSFFLFFALTMILTAAEEPKPLPADAQAAIDAFDKAVAREQAALVTKLQKAQEAATKKGDLDAALAIKARIEALPKTEQPVVSFGSETQATPSISRSVVLCSLPDFKGKTVIVKDYETIINVQKVGFPNDGLRSIRLPTGWTVTVFEHENGGGNSYTIGSETADLNGTPAVGMTSFMINRPKR